MSKRLFVAGLGDFDNHWLFSVEAEPKWHPPLKRQQYQLTTECWRVTLGSKRKILNGSRILWKDPLGSLGHIAWSESPLEALARYGMHITALVCGGRLTELAYILHYPRLLATCQIDLACIGEMQRQPEVLEPDEFDKPGFELVLNRADVQGGRKRRSKSMK